MDQVEILFSINESLLLLGQDVFPESACIVLRASNNGVPLVVETAGKYLVSMPF